MTGTLFRKEALEHQRERLWGEVILTQSVSTRLMTGVLTGVVAAIIAFLILGTYTRKETVPGYLMPVDGLVEVHSSGVGTVTEVVVARGDKVKAGDTLLRVNTGRVLNSGQSLGLTVVELLQQQRRQLQERIERQESRTEKRRNHLERRISSHTEQLAQLKTQRQLQQEQISMLESRLGALQALRDDELISLEDYQSRYQAFLDARQEHERLHQAVLAERSRLEDVRYELSELDTEAHDELSALEAQISELDQRIVRQESDTGFVVRAPADGRIASIQASVGNQIQPQRPALSILPENHQLKAQLLVPSQAIGFMESGMTARLRYHAFPHERFGLHDSEITEISETVLTPEDVDAPVRVEVPVYQVSATLSGQTVRAYGNDMPLQSGMTLEADIQLDSRPLYQWLLKPLYSLKGSL